MSLVKLPPNSFCHVIDRNTLIQKLLMGPQQYMAELHEDVVSGPTPLVVLAPNTYVIVANPVVRDAATGNVLIDAHGAAAVRHGGEEIRVNCAPFPLYPHERLVCEPTPLPHVDVNTALLLRARRDCVDRGGVARKTGDLWLFAGPALYTPSVEIEVVERRSAIIIAPNEALHVRARVDCRDWKNAARHAGEHWLIREPGAYMLPVAEEDVELCTAYVLTSTDALLVRANVSFTTVDNKRRVAGDKYLITAADTTTFIPDVHETVVAQQPLISLSRRQYCVVQNPVDAVTGAPRLGLTEVRRGEAQFFLQPDESLVGGGVYDVIVLSGGEMLTVRCVLPFEEAGVRRKPGEHFYVRGPCDFVPRVEVQIVELSRARVSIEAFDLHLLFAPRMRDILSVTPVNVKPKEAVRAKQQQQPQQRTRAKQ